MEGTRGSSSPSSPGTKRMACSLGRTRCTSGAIARAAAESGASSGTAAKCELCLTTQWCGPPTRRGSRRIPSTLTTHLPTWRHCPGPPPVSWRLKIWIWEGHVSMQKKARVEESPKRWDGVMAEMERRSVCCCLLLVACLLVAS